MASLQINDYLKQKRPSKNLEGSLIFQIYNSQFNLYINLQPIF